MNVGGNLTGLIGTANGLKVDGSAVTQPVSGTVTAASNGSTATLLNGVACAAATNSSAQTITTAQAYVLHTLQWVQTGVLSLTINLQGSNDAGTTWTTLATSSAVSGYMLTSGYFGQIRVNISACSGGTISAYWTGAQSGTQNTMPVTQSGSWSMPVTQLTASNLNATVTQATAANLNATVIGGVANDTSNVANGLETQPAVARAGPSTVTAGRSEKDQIDTVSGGIYTTESPTTNNTALPRPPSRRILR
jgi:hypothetical protein